MLTSYPSSLDSAFYNPIVRSSASSEQQQQCFDQQTTTSPWPCDCDHLLWWTGDGRAKSSSPSPKEQRPAPAKTMHRPVEPEEDLRLLSENEHQLGASGYYYGNLSWMVASHMLRQCRAGTFLVRDSEHTSYLYTLSVQTKRGPTSCRIQYQDGRFRLDCSDTLVPKMPRFETVPQLVEYYVHMTRNFPRKFCGKEPPVWLDMDDATTLDVPVQIYWPLYRNVRSLQQLCRVAIVRTHKSRNPFPPPLTRTLEETECRVLPTVLKNYLKEYPYSQ